MPVLPMFPLGSVLFPSLVLPLHVFEPRYRAMTRDVLAGDGEFGVVLIERGHEVGGDDVRTNVGCVARVVEAAELPDGRWALQAVGTRRIAVREWLPDDPYPRAEVVDLDEGEAGPDTAGQVAELIASFRSAAGKAAELGDPTVPATIELADDPALALHQMAALAPLALVDRYALLAAGSVDERVALLVSMLADAHELLDLRLGAESG